MATARAPQPSARNRRSRPAQPNPPVQKQGKSENSTPPSAPPVPAAPVVLSIDIGGSHVKCRTQTRKIAARFESNPALTPQQMVAGVLEITAGWKFEVVSIGYPGPVAHGRPVAEPHNLGSGWVGFRYGQAFGKPVRIVNDAAMQALGSYEGGRMLFLGLGTGLGSAMIIDGVLAPLELAHHPFKKGRTYEDYLGERGLERLGKKKWRKNVEEAVETLWAALEPEYIVLGGGNLRKLKQLPTHCRPGDNTLAFEGGFRLWQRQMIDAHVQHESE